jgi:hypothetical protein
LVGINSFLPGMFIKNSMCIEILAENVLVDRQLARIPTVVRIPAVVGAKNIGLKEAYTYPQLSRPSRLVL